MNLFHGRLQWRAVGAMLVASIAVMFVGLSTAQSQRPAGVPPPGADARIDEIIKRGTLKVGVTPVFPWVFRNKSGSGDEYRGSSWTLAKAYAEALGVKLEVVQVSNETKVPIVQSGGVDVTIASLAENEQRKQVVDFITYSNTTFCMFALNTNAKIKSIKSVEQMNDENVIFAAYVGTNQYPWIQKTFPKAKLRGVTGSGQAPVDELLSGRADFIVGDSALEPIFENAYKNMYSIPDDCSKSTLNEVPVGHAVAKNQPVFLEFMRSVQKKNDAKVRAAEAEAMKFAREHPDQV